MRLLILGGTVFLGRHVVDAALRAATTSPSTRAGSTAPRPTASSTSIGDRADLAPLQGRALGRRDRHLGLRPGAGRREAALDVGHYVFVSSCNAYPDWPDKPVDEDSPTWTEGEGYGPDKAAAERARARRDGAVVRAGLIVGPHDNIFRLPWWVRRIAEGGEVPAPGRPGPRRCRSSTPATSRPGWCTSPRQRTGGAFNGTAPARPDDDGRAARGRRARDRQRRDAALDPRGQARGGRASRRGWSFRCGCRRAISAPGTSGPSARRPPGCARGRSRRPSQDIWTWLQNGGEAELDDWRAEHRPPRMSAEREAALLRLLC